jgi:hypothetical protein
MLPESGKRTGFGVLPQINLINIRAQHPGRFFKQHGGKIQRIGGINGLADWRIIGLADWRIIGLSDYRIGGLGYILTLLDNQ